MTELFELEALERIIEEKIESVEEVEKMMGETSLADKHDELLKEALGQGFTQAQFEQVFEKMGNK